MGACYCQLLFKTQMSEKVAEGLICSGKVGLNIGRINIHSPVAMKNESKLTTINNDTTMDAMTKNCFVNITNPSTSIVLFCTY